MKIDNPCFFATVAPCEGLCCKNNGPWEVCTNGKLSLDYQLAEALQAIYHHTKKDWGVCGLNDKARAALEKAGVL